MGVDYVSNPIQVTARERPSPSNCHCNSPLASLGLRNHLSRIVEKPGLAVEMNRFLPGHCICSQNCWKGRCGTPESRLYFRVCRGTYEHTTSQPGCTDCGT